MTVQISCIVEGHGEVAAVPILIQRIALSLDPGLPIFPPRPIRVSRNQVVKAGELERVVELAARKISGQGAIFILLDSDNDCPAELGPELLYRARQVRSDLPMAVVLAKREFEAWFLAAAESLRGYKELKKQSPTPEQSGGDRWCKGVVESTDEG